MGFLLQIAMSCPRALSRQVAGAGAGAVSWLCTRWRQVAGAGAGCRCWCRVPGAGAGAGAVSWLCTWRGQVAGAGAGCRCWVPGAGAGAGAVVETGCWCWVPGAGAGAVSWLRMWWRQGAAGCARGGDRVQGAGAGCWLCAWRRGFLFPRTRPLWGSYFLQWTMRTYFCMYNVLCATSGSQPTIISACFSMLHAQ